MSDVPFCHSSVVFGGHVLRWWFFRRLESADLLVCRCCGCDLQSMADAGSCPCCGTYFEKQQTRDLWKSFMASKPFL